MVHKKTIFIVLITFLLSMSYIPSFGEEKGDKPENMKNAAKWQTDPEAFAKLFFGEDLSVRSKRDKTTLIEKPEVKKQVIGSPVEWLVKYGIFPEWIGLPERLRDNFPGGNIAIYTFLGPDITGWIRLLHGSRHDGEKEIDWRQMTWGVPPQSDLILKMNLESVIPMVFKNGELTIYVKGSDLQIDTSSKRCDWPEYNKRYPFSVPGFSSDHNKVKITNAFKFPIKVGLRSRDKGRDLIAPAQGSISYFIPKGKHDIYFQYLTDPTVLYQGDSFELKDHGIEIKIGKVPSGNYNIRKVK